uniref:Uncharacterized protein n=1 Tax=Nelumbo nucifera TaxID=4432 RepID=A0A822ZX80_NELNU|nr:TPA_asm: hypothetical protein HUJ06_019047 [Nelumbo nucifera]
METIKKPHSHVDLEEGGHCRFVVASNSRSEGSICFSIGRGIPNLVHSVKVDKDCMVCHLRSKSTNDEFEISIESGCSCKDDLATTHKKCTDA